MPNKSATATFHSRNQRKLEIALKEAIRRGDQITGDVSPSLLKRLRSEVATEQEKK
jgi:hypothetical protein